jgi:hypothetical protein
MNPPPLPLPYEFTVPGPPVSHQSANKQLLADWRSRVTTAAARDWTAMPLSCDLRIAVTYYHEGDSVRIDGDNMLKPIQDALIGLIYSDDKFITDSETRKTPHRRSYPCPPGLPGAAGGICRRAGVRSRYN